MDVVHIVHTCITTEMLPFFTGVTLEAGIIITNLQTTVEASEDWRSHQAGVVGEYEFVTFLVMIYRHKSPVPTF